MLGLNEILFVGFYTVDTPYENEFKALEFYFRGHGLRYSYATMVNRGSWQKNTQMKGEVVADFLETHKGEKLCYLDVDCLIVKSPVMIADILNQKPQVDIAAPVCFGGEFINSCMPMVANDRTRAVVDRWMELNRQYPDVLPDGRAAWDQRTLWMAIQEAQKSEKITFAPLTPAYHFMADLTPARHPGIEPVIIAARGAVRFRAEIDGGLGRGLK